MKDTPFLPAPIDPAVLRTPQADAVFNRLAQLVATVLKADIALVELVGECGVWHSEVHQAQPEMSIGAGDAGVDPLPFAAALSRLSNPLAAEEDGFAFYACVPLQVDQFNFGKLVIVNRSPRDVGRQEIALMRQLANVIVEALELRDALRQLRQGRT